MFDRSNERGAVTALAAGANKYMWAILRMWNHKLELINCIHVLQFEIVFKTDLVCQKV